MRSHQKEFQSQFGSLVIHIMWKLIYFSQDLTISHTCTLLTCNTWASYFLRVKTQVNQQKMVKGFIHNTPTFSLWPDTILSLFSLCLITNRCIATWRRFSPGIKINHSFYIVYSCLNCNWLSLQWRFLPYAEIYLSVGCGRLGCGRHIQDSSSGIVVTVGSLPLLSSFPPF